MNFGFKAGEGLFQRLERPVPDRVTILLACCLFKGARVLPQASKMPDVDFCKTV